MESARASIYMVLQIHDGLSKGFVCFEAGGNKKIMACQNTVWLNICFGRDMALRLYG